MLGTMRLGRADRDVGAMLSSLQICAGDAALDLDPDHLPLPGVDSTTVHARAAVEFATSTASQEQAAA